jgi:hypothetical protein
MHYATKHKSQIEEQSNHIKTSECINFHVTKTEYKNWETTNLDDSVQDAEPYSNFLTDETFNSDKITLSLSVSLQEHISHKGSVSLIEILKTSSTRKVTTNINT